MPTTLKPFVPEDVKSIDVDAVREHLTTQVLARPELVNWQCERIGLIEQLVQSQLPATVTGSWHIVPPPLDLFAKMEAQYKAQDERIKEDPGSGNTKRKRMDYLSMCLVSETSDKLGGDYYLRADADCLVYINKHGWLLAKVTSTGHGAKVNVVYLDPNPNPTNSTGSTGTNKPWRTDTVRASDKILRVVRKK